MPTLTECFAHVLIEANAFGLPAITHRTGGLASLIKDDINGKLFDIGVNIDDYCDYIIENFNDKEKYRQFCLSSFNEYKTRLNLDNGAKIIIEAMKNSLNSNHH
ncbi:hypothetical protein SDC9_194654 [bioreactor metagenome]|uniref:Glycosyl transferase family 1 domain-containing protein n=1 Tax=bioreactor metagenome TaxID=1076179 RepID=A0A645IFI0_9ZZZZ